MIDIFAVAMVFMNAGGLFRDKNEAIITDLSREEFMEQIGHAKKPKMSANTAINITALVGFASILNS